MVLIGVALMADNQAQESPNSLTIDKVALKTLTKDTNDLFDYPKWSKTVDQIDTEPSINHGLWAYYKGPPFLQRVTLYSGNDRDLTKGGELVRRILGLPLNFGKWEGNHYLDNFETQQMYFLQSNEHSALVIPPLDQSSQPILSERAKQMLHQYISVGHNTVIVTGGTGAIDFINKNLIVEGMTTLEPAWTRGPYEKQETTTGTPYQPLAVTLPNMMNHVHGVRKSSLPLDAVSYYETQGISVIFSLQFQQGKLMFIGYDYSDISKPWIRVLIAAVLFAD